MLTLIHPYPFLRSTDILLLGHHSEFSTQIHVYFGLALILAALWRILSTYTPISDFLTGFFLLMAGTTFLFAAHEVIVAGANTGIDSASYEAGVGSVAMSFTAYMFVFILVAGWTPGKPSSHNSNNEYGRVSTRGPSMEEGSASDETVYDVLFDEADLKEVEKRPVV